MAPAPAALGQVGVTRLTLTDFRSYGHLRLDTDLRPVVVCGRNGAGKTNLLEALSFLAPGRGLRGARLSDVGRNASLQDAPVSWGVAAGLSTPHGPVDLGTGLAAGGGERRTVRINGQPAKGAGALASHLGLIWLTPAMDRLFLEGPAGRRKFLDRLVISFDADHAGRIAAYDHAYRQRLRLLKTGGGDAAWFAALEDTMARHGVALAAGRCDLVGRLSRELAGGRSGAFPAATLALVGAVDTWLQEMPAVDAEDAVRRSLWDERRGIAGAGAGPHRSDLGVAMVAPGHASHGQPAALCSTGEQKALLIAILFAAARLQRAKRGHAPVLLLDEIAAHLDSDRRAALFGEILALGAQAWMTGTDMAVFGALGDSAQFLQAENGDLTPQKSPS
ncbi:MAG: DNA replication/repair protein RecF [Rhodospirillaceae bacterium]